MLRFGVSVRTLGVRLCWGVGFCGCWHWFLRVLEMSSLAVSGFKGLRKVRAYFVDLRASDFKVKPKT